MGPKFWRLVTNVLSKRNGINTCLPASEPYVTLLGSDNPLRVKTNLVMFFHADSVFERFCCPLAEPHEIGVFDCREASGNEIFKAGAGSSVEVLQAYEACKGV